MSTYQTHGAETVPQLRLTTGDGESGRQEAFRSPVLETAVGYCSEFAREEYGGRRRPAFLIAGEDKALRPLIVSDRMLYSVRLGDNFDPEVLMGWMGLYGNGHNGIAFSSDGSYYGRGRITLPQPLSLEERRFLREEGMDEIVHQRALAASAIEGIDFSIAVSPENSSVAVFREGNLLHYVDSRTDQDFHLAASGRR